MTTYQKALRSTAQTLKIHPDWDLENHLAYLESEEYLDLDEMIPAVKFKEGVHKFPLREFVKNWVKYPTRTLEAASNF